jgi:hypothetical protein
LRVRDRQGGVSVVKPNKSDNEADDAEEPNNVNPDQQQPQVRSWYPLSLPENQTEALVFVQENLSLPPSQI